VSIERGKTLSLEGPKVVSSSSSSSLRTLQSLNGSSSLRTLQSLNDLRLSDRRSRRGVERLAYQREGWVPALRSCHSERPSGAKNLGRRELSPSLSLPPLKGGRKPPRPWRDRRWWASSWGPRRACVPEGRV